MCGSLRQHQAMAPAIVGFEHVGQDLFVASLVLGQRTMDARDRTRYGEVDLLFDAEPRGVDDEDRARPVRVRSFERVGVGVFERVARLGRAGIQ